MSQVAAQQPMAGTFAAHPAVDAAAVTEHRWVALYRVAGISALLTGVLIPLQIVAFVVWPPPRARWSSGSRYFRTVPSLA